jgi:photosystem II stability/assembly factor-like uncharacterized protein
VTQLAIDPLTPSTIYAAASVGVRKSTDGGETWESLEDGAPTSVASLVVAPTRPSAIYAGVAVQGHRFCTLSGGVRRSTDNGRTWERADAGLPRATCDVPGVGTQPLEAAIGVRQMAIDPRRPDTLYAVTGALFVSTDGGELWNRVNLPRASTFVWVLIAR